MLFLLTSVALGQDIQLWSAGLDATDTNLVMYWTSNVADCLDVVAYDDPAKTPLELGGPLCEGAGTHLLVDPLANYALGAGSIVELCSSANPALCSTLYSPLSGSWVTAWTVVVDIDLTSAVVQGPDVAITYDKVSDYPSFFQPNASFMVAAQIVDPSVVVGGFYPILGEFADDGVGVVGVVDRATTGIVPGMQLGLCHGNNQLVCGEWVTVDQLPGIQQTGGACPGVVDLLLDGFTPNGNVTLFAASALGTSVIPAGPCAGTSLGLATPASKYKLTANGSGEISPTPNLPKCGGHFQAIDESSCEVTNIVDF